MYKHSPSRNQRSKGFKVKQVLQICVLIAVCFWLIYQVKHSHDKKKEFEESDGSTSLETNSHSLKFGGRKGIQNPLEKKPLITAKKDEEEREEENGVEEDDSKHEKNVEEDNNKHGEREEEQEQEQGKSEMEIEHEMDILNEERDREEVDENEENEDKETKKEDENHVEDHDHEAREEHYKGDDASSAVTHESESLSAKTEKGNPENTIEKMETKVVEDGKVSNNGEEVIVVKNTIRVEEKGEISENMISLKVTTKEKRKSGDVSLKQDDTLVSNSTTTTKFNNEEETGTKLAKKSKETNDTPMVNSTKAKHKAAEGEMSTNPSLNNIRSDSNAEDTQNMETVLVELSNSSASSKTVVSEKEKINVNAERDRNENLELKKETSESETEEGGVDHHDPIDDSDTIVSLEKDVRTNLDNLPHIRTKESNKKEVAAK